MINILPPDLKTQLQYSRANVVVRRYLIVLLLIAGTVGAALIISHSYANEQIVAYKQRLAMQQARLAAYQKDIQKVEAFNTRLATISKLLDGRTNFSELLQDLAAVLPQGSYLAGINLTGDNTEPLELLVTAPSRGDAISVRNALTTSERIASADIQSISDNSDSGEVTVSLVIAFGQKDTP